MVPLEVGFLGWIAHPTLGDGVSDEAWSVLDDLAVGPAHYGALLVGEWRWFLVIL